LIPMNALIVVFVDMFRALPPLVLVLLVYFGLPNIGINLPSFVVLWLVLALVLAAFAEEIFWAGILSIPKGQWEAARSTGLGFLGTLAYIVLPQAIVICLIVIPLGLAGGLAFAIVSLSRLRTVRWAAIAGIDFFRAIPPLVLLIFIYAGLPFAGLRPSPLTAVAIAFFLNTSSYY